MEVIHRYNSDERQHYLFEDRYIFKLKPRLLYAGELKKSGGWQERPHSHKFCEIIFVVDGRGTTTVNEKRLDFQKGDILIYNPDVVHFEESSLSEPTEFMFFALDKFEITDLPQNHLLPPDYNFIYRSGECYDVLYDLFFRMISEFESKKNFYLEISQNISRTILMYIFRVINFSDDSFDIHKSNKAFDLAIKYINDNYMYNISLEDIASKCYVSKYYLSHIFTQLKGISIGKYLISLRIEAAKKLLKNTGLSVSTIAEQSGFGDPNYFSRIFKKETGISPLQYRKNNN